LVYYKKGDEEWGTPLVIVGVDEAKTLHDVKVYPNPARQSSTFRSMKQPCLQKLKSIMPWAVC
jgi:hypothetical protein